MKITWSFNEKSRRYYITYNAAPNIWIARERSPIPMRSQYTVYVNGKRIISKKVLADAKEVAEFYIVCLKQK